MRGMFAALFAIWICTGCARQENLDSGASAGSEQGAATTGTVSSIPNAAGSDTRVQPEAVTTTNAGPSTGVGASAAASGGIGPASASASSGLESEAATGKEAGETQNLDGIATPRPPANESTADTNTNSVGKVGVGNPPAPNY